MTSFDALESERTILAHAYHYRAELRVSPADFATPATRAAALAISELRAEGAPVEPTVVRERLRDVADQFRAVGGVDAFFADLADLAGPASLEWHAAQVADAARRRRLDDVLRRQREALHAGDDVADVRAGAARDLKALADGDADRGRLGWLAAEWKTIADRGGGWLSSPPPRRDYLLRAGLDRAAPGLLAAGRVAMMFASGGSGKTMLLVGVAVGVASGRPVLGAWHVDRPGNVLLALAEEDEGEIRRRLFHAAAVAQLDEEARELVERRVVILPLIGRSIALTTAVAAGGTRETTPVANALLSRLQDRQWSLLIIDPLSRFGGPDVEIDNSAATHFIQTLERLAEAPGRPNVLVAHHAPKVRTGEQKTARGASALRDAVRWEASLESLPELGPTAPRLVHLDITKSNYGVHPAPLILCRDPRHEGALRPATEHEREAYADAEAAARDNEQNGGHPKRTAKESSPHV